MLSQVHWDIICGVEEPFWDSQISWNSSLPHVPYCFQKTVLIWIPCAILWLLCPLEIYKILRLRYKEIPSPWSNLGISKLVLCAFLFSLDSARIVVTLSNYSMKEIQSLDVSASIVKMVTLILVFYLTWKGRQAGIRSSVTLLCFWFCFFISETIIFYSTIKAHYSTENSRWYADLPTVLVEIIYFPIIVAQFCMSLISDVIQNKSNKDDQREHNIEEISTVISKAFFIWYDRVALLGYRRPLEVNDLGTLKYQNSCASILEIFDVTVEKLSMPCKSQSLAKRKDNQDDSKTFLLANDLHPQRPRPFLLKSIMRIFGIDFASVLFYRLTSDVLTYTSPLILSWFILFVASREPNWHGYTYATMFTVVRITEAIFAAHSAQRASVLSLKVRTALMSYVYRKTFRLSTNAKSETTVGEIVNLMAVDISKIMQCIEYFSYVVSVPLQLGISTMELYIYLGPSAMICLIVLVMLQWFTYITAMFYKRAQTAFMMEKDKRIKTINEVLNGIKVLKMFAWEEPYKKYIEQLRNKEMLQLKKLGALQTISVLTWSSSSYLISLTMFAMFVMVDSHNVLDASKAFVTLTILELFRRPLITFPLVVSYMAEGIVSMRRLNKFSFYDELKPEDASTIQREEAIQIRNGSFSWASTDLLPNLFNINLEIPKGSLVAIVGSVGSGKSSLLSAMLGDMNRLKGTVAIEESVAYGAQVPWIQNATLKDNVLFGNEMNEARYWNALESCAMLPDLEMLPGGDMTEIGEKGINLSGGQKQRLSLARAVYFDASTYLLDDPLSAVDAYVGKHIFDNVIGHNGLLKNKTRVLVTHGLTFLPEVDRIIVLSNGTITEAGTYEELITKHGAFAELIDIYTSANDKNRGVKDDDNTDIKGFQIKDTSIKSNIDSRVNVPNESSKKNEAVMQKSEADFKLVKEENSEVGKVKLTVYFTFFKAMGCYGILYSMINIVSNTLRAISSLWISDWSNDQPKPDGSQDIAMRNHRLVIYGIICSLTAISQAVHCQIFVYGNIKACIRFHSQMLKSVFKAPQWFFDTTPIGRILNRFSSDIGIIDVQLMTEIRSLTAYSGMFIVNISIIMYKMPWMIAVVTLFMITFYLIQHFIIASGRQLRRLDSTTRSPIYSLFAESINGEKTIRAYKRQNYFFEKLTSTIDENTLCAYYCFVAQRWLLVRLEILGALLLFAATMFAVAGRESIDPGTIGLIISSTITLTSILKYLFQSASAVETNIVSLERIMQYSRLPQEGTPQSHQNARRDCEWLSGGAIQFKNYVTKYREGLDTVLNGITCSIRGGEKVGVVGRTGAGKSSLTLALFRIIESVEGAIFIDGEDIATIDLHDLRKSLTIIPQDSVMFSGTLRMNLDPFELSSDEAVWNALELAHLKNFVLSLPSGLDHPISERGDNLSVGQRQLLCMARALIKKTKILVLDEATAAVDIETDSLIQTTIRQEFCDCTVITIAHRINTVMDSDRILVLDRGCIVEFDTPANLLQRTNSVFYGMARDAGIASVTAE